MRNYENRSRGICTYTKEVSCARTSLYVCVHEIKREMLVHASRTFFLYKLENFILLLACGWYNVKHSLMTIENIENVK